MQKFKIYLNNFGKVHEFINISDKLDCRLELSSGNYVVDGKAILGIFSLDLQNEIEVRIINQGQEAFDYATELAAFRR